MAGPAMKQLISGNACCRVRTGAQLVAERIERGRVVRDAQRVHLAHKHALRLQRLQKRRQLRCRACAAQKPSALKQQPTVMV